MLAIYTREIKKYFLSPIGYIFIGFFLLVAGIFFSIEILFPQRPNFINVLSNLLFIFLLLIPILTMRLLSEDRNKKVDQLLLTCPLKLTDIVVGKFLAAVTVFFMSLIIMWTYPLIMAGYGHVNITGTLVAFIGFLLIGCSFISIGLFISSITENQIIAAAATFGILMVLWLVDYIAIVLPTSAIAGIVFISCLSLSFSLLVYSSTKNKFASITTLIILLSAIIVTSFINMDFYSGIIYRLLSQLSLLKRLDGFMMGVISIGPLIYYLSFICIFIYMTLRSLEKRRWS